MIVEEDFCSGNGCGRLAGHWPVECSIIIYFTCIVKGETAQTKLGEKKKGNSNRAN